MKHYIKLMRPQHYIKNFLLFLPAFFAGNLFDKKVFFALVVGFTAFSLITSTVYIINDIRDMEKDRMHALKKNRPIASGKISVRKAIIFCVFLMIFGEGILYIVEDSVFNKANGFVILYLLLNMAYSLGLKNQPIIDVIILAGGFVLRALIGGALVQVEISQWFILTIMMFSLYMGLGKRRNELRKERGNETRAVLKYYSYDFLNRYMIIGVTLGLAFYAYWCAGITQKPHMVWTLPIVLIIIMRYELDMEKDSYGDPIEVLLSDKRLIILTLLYIFAISGFMYFF